MPKNALDMYWVLAAAWSVAHSTCGTRETRFWLQLLRTTYRGIPREEHEADDRL